MIGIDFSNGLSKKKFLNSILVKVEKFEMLNGNFREMRHKFPAGRTPVRFRLLGIFLNLFPQLSSLPCVGSFRIYFFMIDTPNFFVSVKHRVGASGADRFSK